MEKESILIAEMVAYHFMFEHLQLCMVMQESSSGYTGSWYHIDLILEVQMGMFPTKEVSGFHAPPRPKHFIFFFFKYFLEDCDLGA